MYGRAPAAEPLSRTQLLADTATSKKALASMQARLRYSKSAWTILLCYERQAHATLHQGL